ncbi:hypothetical protein MTO96_011402 [Rhipicephalus appendiculatus]
MTGEAATTPLPVPPCTVGTAQEWVGGPDSKPHQVTLRFLHPIKPEESRYVVRPRGTEFVLAKAEEGPFWKRLLQDDVKHHWLKVDFNKWVDEDDSGDELGAGGG